MMRGLFMTGDKISIFVPEFSLTRALTANGHQGFSDFSLRGEGIVPC